MYKDGIVATIPALLPEIVAEIQFDRLALDAATVGSVVERLLRVREDVDSCTWTATLVAVDGGLTRRLVGAALERREERPEALLRLMGVFPRMVPHLRLVERYGVGGLLLAYSGSTLNHLTGVGMGLEVPHSKRAKWVEKILVGAKEYANDLVRYNRMWSHCDRYEARAVGTKLDYREILHYVPYDIIANTSEGGLVTLALRTNCAEMDRESRKLATERNATAEVEGFPEPLEFLDLLEYRMRGLVGVSLYEGRVRH